nr:PREDICTED: BAHD acyltransferase DCR-like [Bemisia tabaci]
MKQFHNVQIFSTVDRILMKKTSRSHSTMPTPTTSPILISKCMVFPTQKSNIKSLKLSVSDISWLACEYNQKGILLPYPPGLSFDSLLTSLKKALATTLKHFYPLAGRLTTTPDGEVHIACNDAGVEFLAVDNAGLSVDDILCPGDVPDSIKNFFTYDTLGDYEGHSMPLAAIKVTKLADGVFIAFCTNHSVADGLSHWDFINTFAEISRGAPISTSPVFSRDTPLNPRAVLPFPPGGPTGKHPFGGDASLTERVFHFSGDAISKLKQRANEGYSARSGGTEDRGGITSFQSLCALMWRSITRARQQTTLFRMSVDCRNRLEPRLDRRYFGNAILGAEIAASADDLLTNDLSWGARLIHETVATWDDSKVRRRVAEWEREPRAIPNDIAEGPTISVGSSPRFPVYEADFGWGRPLAVRSGRNNKFDGKITAFPAKEGDGGVVLEVALAPETMTRLEVDSELMQYASHGGSSL